MISVAITGNIGSGKSYVSALFHRMGFHVYLADREAGRLMNTPEVTMRIADRFGIEFLTPDGLPDRKKLATCAFSDPSALQWLNRTIHPLVMADWERWKTEYNDEPLVFMESAIVFENDLQHHFNATILVSAPDTLRIRRVMSRDGLDEASVRQRMQSQWDEDKKLVLADYSILNDEKTLLLPQMVRIVDLLLNKPA